jgi:peptide/nickel transport system ATP-binding protein
MVIVDTYNSVHDSIVLVKELVKRFPLTTGLFAKIASKQRFVHAVNDVSFSIQKGTIFALAGESGCGKTTTGKLIAKITEPTSGRIYFEDIEITHMKSKEFRHKFRKKIQMIFQNPYTALNPRWSVYDLVSEPLKLCHIAEGNEEERVTEMLETCRLTPPERFKNKLPHQLSGGQRQRVAIARAMVVDPTFIVADEPVSMLDTSIRASILNFIREINRKFAVTFLLITHDIAVASYLSRTIGIMYLGKMMEIGSTETVVKNPAHPYTQALISSVPSMNVTRERTVLRGELPNPVRLPTGCFFYSRCGYRKDRCSREMPSTVKVGKGHYVSCFQYN